VSGRSSATPRSIAVRGRLSATPMSPPSIVWTVPESIQPPFSSHEERIAYNESWFRELNKRKAEWMKSGRPAAGFRCECWRMECGDRIQLSGDEWKVVRSQPNRFAVAPGHASPELAESVIEEYPHFWIVEKQGEAKEIAEKLA